MTKEQLETAIFGADEELEMTDERARATLKACGIDENELVNKFIDKLVETIQKLTQENKKLRVALADAIRRPLGALAGQRVGVFNRCQSRCLILPRNAQRPS